MANAHAAHWPRDDRVIVNLENQISGILIKVLVIEVQELLLSLGRFRPVDAAGSSPILRKPHEPVRSHTAVAVSLREDGRVAPQRQTCPGPRTC